MEVAIAWFLRFASICGGRDCEIILGDSGWFKVVAPDTASFEAICLALYFRIGKRLVDARPHPTLNIAHNFGCRPANPKGIASCSPGLRGTSYPGKTEFKIHQPQRGCIPTTGKAATPLGLGFFFGFPRVGAGRQPWASRRNPFGIRETTSFASSRGWIKLGVCSARKI